MFLNCGVGEDSWESLGLQGDPTSPSWKRSVLNIHWNTDAEAETRIFWPPDEKSWLIWKDHDAGKDLGRRRRGWQKMNGWMTLPTQWTRIWANSGRQWRTGKPGVLPFMGLQKVRHDWATEQQQRRNFLQTPLKACTMSIMREFQLSAQSMLGEYICSDQARSYFLNINIHIVYHQ